jgi:prolipoprotein diacylglyceryltransferase
MVFTAFLVLYGSWRFVIDYLRYYEAAMFASPLGITWNQTVSLAMVAIGVVMGLRLVKRDRVSSAH